MKSLLYLIILLSGSFACSQGMEIPEEPERTSDAQIDLHLKSHVAYLSVMDEIPKRVIADKDLIKLSITESYKITELPKKIGRLDQLEELYLGGVGISELPKQLFKLEGLKKLTISNTFISQLPESIENFKNLVELKISTVPVKSLPESLGNLKSLKKLDLSNLYGNYRIGSQSFKLEGISTLPQSMKQLVSLEDFSAYRSGIKVLPAGLGNLSSLKALGLGGNLLTQLPDDITQLENLERLHLSRNPLESLPENIGDLSNLMRIDLDYTLVDHLPESIKKLKNLRGLFVIGTKIQDAELRSIQAALPDCTIYNSIGKKM